MKLKTMIKKTTACLAAIGCLSLNVTAYAAEDRFNPVYSGKLTSLTTADIYMLITEQDARLNRVPYPVSAGTDRFVTVSGADTCYFSAKKLAITYDHAGTITTSDGTYVGQTSEDIFVETDGVEIKYGLFNKIKGVKVIYNGYEYNS